MERCQLVAHSSPAGDPTFIPMPEGQGASAGFLRLGRSKRSESFKLQGRLGAPSLLKFRSTETLEVWVEDGELQLRHLLHGVAQALAADTTFLDAAIGHV